MKLEIFNRGAAVCMAGAFSLGMADGAEKPDRTFRDVATHEQLVEALQRSEQADPMKLMQQAEGEDPSVAARPKDILSESDIICFNGVATLVPKHSIVQVPEAYRSRLSLEPGARLVGWLEFFALNRGWISTLEISRVQAEGNEPLDEEVEKVMSKSGNLVVAVFQGGPISKLPLKTPPSEAEAGEAPINIKS